jgi:hypothetical protein
MGIWALPLGIADGNKETTFVELYHAHNLLDNQKIAFLKLVTLKLVIYIKAFHVRKIIFDYSEDFE